MAFDEIFSDYENLQKKLEGEVHDGNFALVDLVGSTIFKSAHPELTWVTRLRTFYDLVSDAIKPLGVTKFLGDAVFISVKNNETNAADLLESAKRTCAAINKYNQSAPSQHKINFRIILNSGSAFFFNGGDPQGISVDKLFRMEKFVPDDCIGVTEEFAAKAAIGIAPVARFPLKGIPSSDGHGLILVLGPQNNSTISKIVDQSRAGNLWGLGEDEDASIFLVGGYIPDQINMVQMGDVNAKINALHILSKIKTNAVYLCDSADFPDAAYNENIISIGGPCFNNVTRRLMESLPVRFENLDDPEDDDTPLIDQETGTKFQVERDERGITKDWGLFVRCDNPLNRDKKIIIACGIESPAVDGIVRAFSPSSNQQFSRLVEQVLQLGEGQKENFVPDFYCVMGFRVEANGRASLPPFKEQTRHLRVIQTQAP